tara:strand:- start:1006 stop:1350 length:345 start_codon:yes stop_codon:yes gene_type:complete
MESDKFLIVRETPSVAVLLPVRSSEEWTISADAIVMNFNNSAGTSPGQCDEVVITCAAGADEGAVAESIVSSLNGKSNHKTLTGTKYARVPNVCVLDKVEGVYPHPSITAADIG